MTGRKFPWLFCPMHCNVLLLHTIMVYNINLVLSSLFLVKELQWELVPWAHLSQLEIPHCHQEPFPRRANQITQWSFASAGFQWSEVVHTDWVPFVRAFTDPCTGTVQHTKSSTPKILTLQKTPLAGSLRPAQALSPPELRVSCQLTSSSQQQLAQRAPTTSPSLASGNIHRTGLMFSSTYALLLQKKCWNYFQVGNKTADILFLRVQIPGLVAIESALMRGMGKSLLLSLIFPMHPCKGAILLYNSKSTLSMERASSYAMQTSDHKQQRKLTKAWPWLFSVGQTNYPSSQRKQDTLFEVWYSEKIPFMCFLSLEFMSQRQVFPETRLQHLALHYLE